MGRNSQKTGPSACQCCLSGCDREAAPIKSQPWGHLNRTCLPDDNRRHASVNGEISQGPTPRSRAPDNQWLLIQGESDFSRDKVCDNLSNPKWSALHLCTKMPNELGSMWVVCVCICVCTCVCLCVPVCAYSLSNGYIEKVTGDTKNTTPNTSNESSVLPVRDQPDKWHPMGNTEIVLNCIEFNIKETSKTEQRRFCVVTTVS